MNEEEKKAICELKNYISRRKLNYTKLDRHDKSIDNLLNLIEKLQKENEELKADRDKFKKALAKRITYCNELEKDLFENCSNYVISKQKVKDKIEKLNKKEKEELKGMKGQDRYFVKQTYQNKKMILQELIKESEE